MSTIRVIAGDLKGKNIPFAVNKYNNADITSQKIKGAIFSKIGEYLHDKSFLDLYAGSGQIGIEALSRGARPVIFNEVDNKRFLFIKQYITGLDKDKDVMLFNYFANRLLAYLGKRSIKLDYIFVDPPYEKQVPNPLLYKEILRDIDRRDTLHAGGIIILQHFSKNRMDDQVGPYSLIDAKEYGNTTLSFYQE